MCRMSPHQHHRFQSPSNRVNIPNSRRRRAARDRFSNRFNPLVIGSIFQTVAVDAKTANGTTAFQSPSNRVNIPNLVSVDCRGQILHPGFNPLVIGSIFQTNPSKSTSVFPLNYWFQSPSNRVNIPNPRPGYGGGENHPKFQSPSNRVNIPNPTSVAQSYTDDLGFNPLVIGSIFQTSNCRWAMRDDIVVFQSPSNRVNIPNRMP